MVESGLYRASAMGSHHIPFLKAAGVKSVVNMSTDQLPQHLAQAMEQAGNDMAVFQPCAPQHGGDGVGRSSTGGEEEEEARSQISDEIAKEALEIVLDPRHQPLVMTMASPGGLEVCTLVGCLRRLQRWALTAVLYEFKLYAPTAPMYDVHRQFVERFDVSIVTPPLEPPDWLAAEEELLSAEVAMAEHIAARRERQERRARRAQLRNHRRRPNDAAGKVPGDGSGSGGFEDLEEIPDDEGEGEVDDDEDEATRSARLTHERFYYCHVRGEYVPLKSKAVMPDQISTVLKHDDGD